jgi:hypothetical protein
MKKKDFEPITADEDLVTPERLKKGDLWVGYNAKDNINKAAVNENTIIKFLVKNDILNHHHEIYGLGFLELQAAFRAPWATRSCAVLLEQWGTGTSVGRATEIYQNVCRGLLGRGLEVVQFALNETKLKSSTFSNGLYQEHFEKLVAVMDAERERIYREEQEKIRLAQEKIKKP